MEHDRNSRVHPRLNSADVARFQKMLLNERFFDRLFCDVSSTAKFDLYYNEHFKDDPVFNHAVVKDSFLSSKASADSASILLREIKAEAARCNVPPTIFVEEFWEHSVLLQKEALVEGYVVSGFMDILSKAVLPRVETASHLTVEESTDLKLWNQIFMKSYLIPAHWEQELLRREQIFLKLHTAKLLLARDAKSKVVGCILTQIMPPEYLGVYCVGTMPEMRHHGVASTMLLEVERRAATLGCKYLTLQTISSDGVTPLYLKLGYKVEFRRTVLQLA